MLQELQEAIESARSVDCGRGRRRQSFQTLRYRILEFLRNAPEEMSVRELREELEP